MRSTGRSFTAFLILTVGAFLQVGSVRAADTRKPNVIIIFADDLGYADLSCQGSGEVLTPRIDSLAAGGVRFTSGYVSAPQCSPSRAGLMTGRYQNRFGFEYNFGAAERDVGLPTTERTIADYMKQAGYVTGIVGKWHLGEVERFRPYNRGFQETFWHPNGGVYFPNPAAGGIPGLRRGPEQVKVQGYSTDVFAHEAVEFIGRHQQEPFFLYVPFITPHWPMEAKPEHLKRFEHVKDLHRRTYLAMMASLDENVGKILDKLSETKLEEQTLIFFLSDNGGPTGPARKATDEPFSYGQNTSLNTPLRGVKGDMLEGGIRVPFIAQWKNHLPAGKVYEQPVISLDILPTALAAAGVKVQPEQKLDGTNLLPFISGQSKGTPHETLCWRFNFPPDRPERYRWAIRQGNWKLVKNDKAPLALYDLSKDIGEANNVIEQQRDRAAALETAWKGWNAQLMKPSWKGTSLSPARAAKKKNK